MSEHDYVIANDTGANVRADLNLAFLAIQSQNSKSSAPSTTYAYMFWADTANDLLKQRNAANNAWISILTLSTGAVTTATTEMSGDSTPQLAGFLDANGNYIQMQKGGDIASASPLVIDTDGDFFLVSGTTNFSVMTVAADRHFFLEFGGALTMTHGNGTLDLPGAGNITTAASDVGEFVSTAANVVTCVNYTKRDGTAVVSSGGGKIVQVVNVMSAAVATGTTQMPVDDTIPQITEGDEYLTLAITPTSALNKLLIQIVMQLSTTGTSQNMGVAIFQDTTAGALAANDWRGSSQNNAPNVVTFSHYMTSGTTSATTFKVRAGTSGSTTVTFNGTGGNRQYGGVGASSITIWEVSV